MKLRIVIYCEGSTLIGLNFIKLINLLKKCSKVVHQQNFLNQNIKLFFNYNTNNQNQGNLVLR